MCFHWQAGAARKLEELVKNLDKEQVLAMIKTEEAADKKNLENATAFATKEGYELESVMKHGFFAGNHFAFKLNVEVLMTRLSQLNGSNAVADLPPANSIILVQ